LIGRKREANPDDVKDMLMPRAGALKERRHQPSDTEEGT